MEIFVRLWINCLLPPLFQFFIFSNLPQLNSELKLHILKIIPVVNPHLFEMNGGNRGQFVKMRIMEGSCRMCGIPTGDLEDDSSRLGGPVGGGEGEPIVRSSIVRLEMF